MNAGRFMKCIVAFSILAVVAYTIVAIIFQYKTGNTLSNQLTIGWFSFFGVELINLAYVKKEKIRRKE